MATVFDSPWLRGRLERAGAVPLPREPPRACDPDCTSCSYLVLSLVLFAVGTAVTVLALGDADGRLFSHLGHMWLVGPIFICSGLMVAVKSMLYLRRKSVVQMLLHREAVFRNIAAAQAEQAFANSQVVRTASTLTLPPSYNDLNICGTLIVTPHQSSSELPPPTYEEAVFLIGEGKNQCTLEVKTSNDNMSKGSSVTIDMCQNSSNIKP